MRNFVTWMLFFNAITSQIIAIVSRRSRDDWGDSSRHESDEHGWCLILVQPRNKTEHSARIPAKLLPKVTVLTHLHLINASSGSLTLDQDYDPWHQRVSGKLEFINSFLFIYWDNALTKWWAVLIKSKQTADSEGHFVLPRGKWGDSFWIFIEFYKFSNFHPSNPIPGRHEGLTCLWRKWPGCQ